LQQRSLAAAREGFRRDPVSAPPRRRQSGAAAGIPLRQPGVNVIKLFFLRCQ
jgi:hypothetical protein